MSLRFPPLHVRAHNLFYQDNLVIREAPATFLPDAVDQAAKVTLIAENIATLFSLSTTPALTMSVVILGQE